MYNNNETEQQFKQHLEYLGYTQNTVLMAYASIKEFLCYTAMPVIENINQEQIQSYYEHLQNRSQKRKDEPLSEVYINHQMYCLKLFFSWLEQTHQISYNPISNIQFKRPKVNTRQPLSQYQIKQLFDSTQNLQEKTILHLCYSCGLRRSEAVNLNLIDIDFGNNVLYVRNGKGAKRRVIPINKTVKNDLENYVKEYRKDKDLEPFMLSRIKKRMLGDGYNRLLKELLKRTEIIEEITLHHLRHSIATHLLENGMSIEFVRDFLGHSHLESTQIYAKVRSYQIKKL